VVREYWLQAIDESRLSQRFMGGAVSFGTLMPMRAIPFRVVCLLGMNDGDYPRRQTPMDFDLMAQSGQARPGDRSRREDDRYLFLEALLSARDALHVSWVGRSARDNSELPPSVLVGQLRDYLAAGWHREGEAADAPDAGEHLLQALTCEYPLQPFSLRYFESGHDAHGVTYVREWQQAHR
jgi:exodeoxyribonuclease V gamma subunit